MCNYKKLKIYIYSWHFHNNTDKSARCSCGPPQLIRQNSIHSNNILFEIDVWLQFITHGGVRPPLLRRLNNSIDDDDSFSASSANVVSRVNLCDNILPLHRHTRANLSSLTFALSQDFPHILSNFAIPYPPDFLSVSVAHPQPNCLFVWHVQFQTCWDSASKNRCEGQCVLPQVERMNRNSTLMGHQSGHFITVACICGGWK